MITDVTHPLHLSLLDVRHFLKVAAPMDSVFCPVCGKGIKRDPIQLIPVPNCKDNCLAERVRELGREIIAADHDGAK